MKNYIKGYPRPQFIRENWQNLNGTWEFSFDDEREGEKNQWYKDFSWESKINVPFNYETKMSGIGDESFHPVVWYKRTFSVDGLEKDTILHFEASDWYTKAWVNGKYAGDHKGGNTRFSFDITNLLTEGDNSLVVMVEDSFDKEQPRGKQRWLDHNFGCFYVQTTGIWKTVWLERINRTSIESFKMTPCIKSQSLAVEWKIRGFTDGPLTLKANISFKDTFICTAAVTVNEPKGKFSIDVNSNFLNQKGISLWTPENPNLYDITFELVSEDITFDTVHSYFGMRDISVKNGQILLNGIPYYQRLILDQGYWEDSHLTPPSEEALILDIERTKELGFNGARKHQKVEDELYYYWCDVKGLLVWSEMPSPYTFGDDMMENFIDEWQTIVKMHYNHPSVIVWTPINESWGVSDIAVNKKQQHFSEAIYYMTKAVDSMRPVITNDGWEHTVSDIVTLHDYRESGEEFFDRYTKGKADILSGEITHNRHKFAFAQGYEYKGQPVLISEYGGAAYVKDASGAAWGYGKGVETEDDLLYRINDMTSAIRHLPYSCGYCYTQLTDVQQEVNGLLDVKRDYKADKNKLYEIFSLNDAPRF